MSEATQETGNQTVESQDIERDAATEALYESFGMPRQQQEQKEVEFPNMDEPTDESLTTDEESEEPDEETKTPEKRTFKYKYNGEEGEVDEEEAPKFIQKGMNYDKVQQKLTEQEKQLNELAQLQGYKDHAELLANIPKMREQQQQKQQDEFKQLVDQVVQELVDNGVSEENARAFAENNPLVRKAREDLQRGEKRYAEEQERREREAYNEKWQVMYNDPRVLAAFPDIVEDSQALNRGETPKYLTAEMKSRLERGYDPLDALMLAHSDKFQGQAQKMTQQRMIKEQQLGLRGHVNEQTAATPDEGSLTPVQRSLAEEFGVDIKGVQRQQKQLQSRR